MTVTGTNLLGLVKPLRIRAALIRGYKPQTAQFAETAPRVAVDYLVAVDDLQRQFAGLVRIGVNANRARLGLIAVTQDYRRRGLAGAMVASALRPLQERGVLEVLAEADASNSSSLGLLRSFNAFETGASVVLRHFSKLECGRSAGLQLTAASESVHWEGEQPFRKRTAYRDRTRSRFAVGR